MAAAVYARSREVDLPSPGLNLHIIRAAARATQDQTTLCSRTSVVACNARDLNSHPVMNQMLGVLLLKHVLQNDSKMKRCSVCGKALVLTTDLAMNLISRKQIQLTCV